jgi:hemolysin III
MVVGERLNIISHTIGATLAAVSGMLLIVTASRTSDHWKIASCSVYAAMLFILYVTSTLYHSAQGPAKRLLRKMDHCAIYLLIAGSYTPFTLVTLRGCYGWPMFGIVWTLALVGICQELWYAKGARTLSLVIYLVMGWLAVVVIVPLLTSLGWAGVGWLVAGGTFYTVGIGFYVGDHRLRYGHGIWHLFVLVGSICHYIAVFFYVV